MKQAVATKQPMCVDGIRRLCMKNTDFDRYRKIQRYLERQQGLTRTSTLPGQHAASEALSPTQLDTEEEALEATAAEGLEDGADTGDENVPPAVDTAKLMLLDPCLYNLSQVLGKGKGRLVKGILLGL